MTLGLAIGALLLALAAAVVALVIDIARDMP